MNMLERDHGKGLGLGLAIVERLARLLSIPITLISKPQYGSMFAIDIPLVTGNQLTMPVTIADTLEKPIKIPLSTLIADFRLHRGENGIDTIAKLRDEFNETIPALLITGDSWPERICEIQASGLQVLYKPLRKKDLQKNAFGVNQFSAGYLFC